MRAEVACVADPRGQQAGAELRFQRLTERVVLREGQGGDEFTESKGGGRQNGEFSRCIGGAGSAPFIPQNA